MEIREIGPRVLHTHKQVSHILKAAYVALF